MWSILNERQIPLCWFNNCAPAEFLHRPQTKIWGRAMCNVEAAFLPAPLGSLFLELWVLPGFLFSLGKTQVASRFLLHGTPWEQNSPAKSQASHFPHNQQLSMELPRLGRSHFLCLTISNLFFFFNKRTKPSWNITSEDPK